MHVQLHEVGVATIVAVHIFEGADLIGGERTHNVHVLVVFASGLGISPEESIEAKEEVILSEFILAEEFAIEFLLQTHQIRHEAVLHELHPLVLDVIVGGPLQIGNHMGRNSEDGGHLGLLELAGCNELRILRRDGDALVGHSTLKEERGMGIMEADRLLNKVMLQALVRLRLQSAGVLEHPGHVAALGEEFLSIILRRLRQGEVFPVYGNRGFALVTVGGETLEVDDIVAGEEFTVGKSIKHLVIRGEDGLALIGLEFLEAHRTEIPIPMDPDIAVAPEGAADHEVVQETEASQVGVRLGEDCAARVSLGLLPAGVRLVVEVDRKGADRLRQDPDTGPDCRDGQRAFRGDDSLLGGIGHGVGEKHLVHRVLEFA